MGTKFQYMNFYFSHSMFLKYGLLLNVPNIKEKVRNGNSIGQNAPNTACTGQVRAFAHTFGILAPSGGFNVCWLCPPIPALAGTDYCTCQGLPEKLIFISAR